MKSVIKGRFFGYAVILFAYILAACIGIWTYVFVPASFLIKILVADVVATVVVYIISEIFGNASIYDPYWSVAPIVILPAVAIHLGIANLGTIVLLAVVGIWGIRLTANWAYTFTGLGAQDWRYDLLKEKSKGFFFLVNLFGIQMVPTLVVYSAMLPALRFLEAGAEMGACSWIGAVIVLLGTALELFADIDMQKFRRSEERSGIIRIGLWKHARHPNYLGEILVWWGVYVIMLGAYPEYWYFGAGALINTLLFTCISIPMADKRNAARKPGWEQYKKETRCLLPIKKRGN